MASARLFFAVWPDARALGRLSELAAELAEESGGRPTPAERIHLTLEFLGNVEAERVPVLGEIAAGLELPRFQLSLDRTGAFRRARVAWAGSDAPATELIHLQAVLRAALRSEGFAVEDRDYSPHVTLARKIERSVARRPIEPIVWKVREVTLVRSMPGTGEYARLAAWPLG